LIPKNAQSVGRKIRPKLKLWTPKFFTKDLNMKIIDKLKIEKKEVYNLWDKTQTFSVNFLKVFLASVFLVLVIHTSLEIFSHDLVIKPFETPFNLARTNGYTGVVVARQLQDQMDEIREEIRKSSSGGKIRGVVTAQFSELQKQQKIDIPTVGLSLNAIVYQFRKMFGMKQRSITGEVVKKDEKFYLTLRITGKPVVNLEPATDIDKLIKKAAREVLKKLEPLTFGLNYYANNKQKELISLIDELRQVERFQKTELSQKEEAIVLTLEGCLLAIQAKPTIQEFDQEKLNQAMVKFDKAEKLAPTIIRTILRIKGNTFTSLKEYDKAIDSYKKALKFDSKRSGDIYVQWAIALIAEGKLDEAELKFEEAAKNDPDNPWVYTAWGERLLAKELKKYTEAYEKFEKAKEKNPKYALNYAIWGDTLYNAKNYQEAIKKFKRTRELDLKVAWVYRKYGLTLFKLGKHQEAVKEFERAIELNPRTALNTYHELADVLVKLKRYEQAVVQFKQAIKLNPNLPTWVHGNYRYALVKSGRYQEAVEQYKLAIELKPDDGSNYYKLGKTLVELKQYKQAVVQFQKAIELDNNHAWSYIKLGYTFLQLQKPQEALTQCKTALKRQKTKNSANDAAAGAYAICGLARFKLSQPKEAFEDCKTALNFSEKEDWANWCLGDIYMSRNEPKAAVKQYEAAVKLKPKDSRYRYKFGQALAKTGQSEKAITQYQKASEIDKESETSKQAQTEIEKLKKARSQLLQ
jgi:tetratricopeptide (TPR) repeat protein